MNAVSRLSWSCKNFVGRLWGAGEKSSEPDLRRMTARPTTSPPYPSNNEIADFDFLNFFEWSRAHRRKEHIISFTLVASTIIVLATIKTVLYLRKMGEEERKRKEPPTEVDAAAEGVSSKKEKKELSKRQRRKQPNDKQLWPQHPKIQSMEARSKAYIRVAGFGTSKKETVDPKLDLLSPEVKFGRLLGGTDQRKRHAAVSKLKAYLKARCDINNEDGGISEMDLMKLWKGLWFTLYMADKVPVQDELSKRLAELIWCVAGTEEEDEYAGQAYMDMCGDGEGQEEDDDDDEYDDDEDITMEEIVNTLEGGSDDSDEEEEEENEEEEEHVHDENCDHLHDDEDEELDDSEIPHCRGAHLASLFIRTFFRTVRREWGNMDKYRVDKFYTLIRLYMHEVFKYMALRHWNLGIIRLFNDCIFEEILNKTPNGLRYHLIDLALEELAKVNAEAPMPLTEATFLDTLEPYFAMAQTGAQDDTVQARVIERVLERFLNEYSVVSEKAVQEEEDDDADKEASLIMDQVHVGSVAQFIFELASDPETNDRYRKSLYDMHKSYMRRVKAVGTDVELPNGAKEGDEDEEPISQEEAAYDAMEDSQEKEEEEEPPVIEKKSKGKKKEKESTVVAEEVKEKKKKRKSGVEEDLQKSVKVKESPKSGKKKKGSKAKQEPEPENEEEVITISLSEQKRAKAEGKKKNKTEAKEEEKIPVESKKKSSKVKKETEDQAKRVKFSAANRSKSYKASMKALVTTKPPKTSETTPEKGILLNKGKIKRASVTKTGGRKRAANYF